MRLPKEGEIWKHYKGSTYRVLYIGRYESDMEPVVIYTLNKVPDEIWVRPVYDFLKLVTKQTGSTFKVSRFEFIKEEDNGS